MSGELREGEKTSKVELSFAAQHELVKDLESVVSNLEMRLNSILTPDIPTTESEAKEKVQEPNSVIVGSIKSTTSDINSVLCVLSGIIKRLEI